MSTSHLDDKRRGRGWPLPVLGAIILLLGLVLAVGGGYLAVLGGSWYYVLAGTGLVVSGVQLVRGRASGAWWFAAVFVGTRSEEHTSELQSLMRISYAVFCLK